MKLQDQVCSLEQAKRLKELGVVQESLFYHTQHETPSNPNQHEYGYKQENMPWGIFYTKRSILSGSCVHLEYSAFTVAELGVMLPEEIEAEFTFPEHWANDIYKIKKHYCQLNLWKLDIETNGFGVCYQRENIINIRVPQDAKAQCFFKHEAEARAEMIIHLLENKYITVEEINSRLQPEPATP